MPGILVEGAGGIDQVACVSVGFVVGVCCEAGTDSLDFKKVVGFKKPADAFEDWLIQKLAYDEQVNPVFVIAECVFRMVFQHVCIVS